MYNRLQYISQGTSAKEHLQYIHEVLDAGCTWIQLRMKNFDSSEIENTALKVRELCTKYKAVFIMNDNVLIAKNCDADGVHLGLLDMPIMNAREVLGQNKIIGGTANTLNHVIQRIDEKCNYIGLGPYRFTTTKDKLSPILGLEGYKKIISELNELQQKTPIYAIGGILTEDIEGILNAGVYGIAASGIITQSNNKKNIIEQLKNELYASS
ncbi:MAG: thiamine phosphate synthase [Bacteroidota bacterium]|nr:thiamine phosphate synthase [Bacteroidota bacterium]